MRVTFTGEWGGDLQVHSGDTLETEAKEMRRLGQHPHLLTFHGVARSDKWWEKGTERELHLVTELAPHGTLLDALHAFVQQGVTAVSDVVLLTLAQQVRPRWSLRDFSLVSISISGAEPSELFAWGGTASVGDSCSMPGRSPLTTHDTGATAAHHGWEKRGDAGVRGDAVHRA
jgi:hypothetical protein